MTKQITRKLDHEKGKLRDKALNPDYHDRFQEEGERFDRGGKGGPLRPRFTSGGKLVLASILVPVMRDLQIRACHVFEHRIRSLRLKVGHHLFEFKHSPASFAKANNLTLAQAHQLLPEVRRDAEELLRMTKGRLLTAEPWGRQHVDSATGTARVEWYLTFKTFLIPVEPQPWHGLYKKLHLDPVEHEPDAL